MSFFFKATHYNAYITERRENLKNGTRPSLLAYSMDMLQTVPKIPHTKEMLKVAIPQRFLESNETLWIALTTVDELGVESNISNIVSARYIAINAQALSGADEVPKMDIAVYIMIGVFALSMLTIIIILIILCRRKRRQRAARQVSLPDVVSKVAPPNIDNNIAFISDLAEHDQLYMTLGKLNAYHQKPLANTKASTTSLPERIPISKPSTHYVKPNHFRHKQCRDAPQRISLPSINLATLPEDLALGETYAQGIVNLAHES